MARCPQCGQEVANFANHRHDSAGALAASVTPWPLLGFVWLGRKLFRKFKRKPEPMSVIYRKPPTRPGA
jgi:hypothetical protein